MRANEANEIRKSSLEKKYLEMLETRKNIFKSIEEAAATGRHNVVVSYVSYEEVLVLEYLGYKVRTNVTVTNLEW